jgi:NADH-quinone oxidoreductase subunit J
MINYFLLFCLVVGALWAVLTTRLIRSVVALAVTSAILSILMFRWDAPLAGVFELSVCAGLIPVIFIIVISFTKRMTPESLEVAGRERFKKFIGLPFILILSVFLLLGVDLPKLLETYPILFDVNPSGEVRQLLWNSRQFDLLGQMIILLAGAFAVVLLFKERKK